MAKNESPSPKPMPVTSRPDRPEYFERGMTSLGMRQGMTTDRPMPVNSGRAAEEEK
jgi:hypothetical protein